MTCYPLRETMPPRHKTITVATMIKQQRLTTAATLMRSKAVGAVVVVVVTRSELGDNKDANKLAKEKEKN